MINGMLARGNLVYKYKVWTEAVHGTRVGPTLQDLTLYVIRYTEPRSACQLTSVTGGNSKEAVQPALSRRSSGVVECIQCTPISEAPARQKW